MSFFEALAQSNFRSRHQIAIGVDPNLSDFPPHSKNLQNGIGDWLFRYGVSLYEASLGLAEIFKIQSAFFEAHGAEGFEAMRRLIGFLKSKRCWVILDAKRGDISSTMHAYATAAFDYFQADALTVLPYMGISTVSVLAPWMRQGKGVYLVWVSSNPDGVHWQTPIRQRILHDLLSWEAANELKVGLVLGATQVGDLEDELWQEVSLSPLLLPGFGAQGAVLDVRHQELQTQSPASLFPISRGLFDPRFHRSESFEDIAKQAREQLLIQIKSLGWGT